MTQTSPEIPLPPAVSSPLGAVAHVEPVVRIEPMPRCLAATFGPGLVLFVFRVGQHTNWEVWLPGGDVLRSGRSPLC